MGVRSQHSWSRPSPTAAGPIRSGPAAARTNSMSALWPNDLRELRVLPLNPAEESRSFMLQPLCAAPSTPRARYTLREPHLRVPAARLPPLPFSLSSPPAASNRLQNRDEPREESHADSGQLTVWQFQNHDQYLCFLEHSVRFIRIHDSSPRDI